MPFGMIIGRRALVPPEPVQYFDDSRHCIFFFEAGAMVQTERESPPFPHREVGGLRLDKTVSKAHGSLGR